MSLLFGKFFPCISLRGSHAIKFLIKSFPEDYTVSEHTAKIFHRKTMEKFHDAALDVFDIIRLTQTPCKA